MLTTISCHACTCHGDLLLLVSVWSARRSVHGTYAATKMALEGINTALRRELLPMGVAVSIINPGAVSTASELPPSYLCFLSLCQKWERWPSLSNQAKGAARTLFT